MARDVAQVTIKAEGRDDYEFGIAENWDRQQALTIHSLTMPDQVAQTAMEMMQRWGTVAATPDGEDSSGRSKLRLQTAQELTDYAFAAAEAFWAKAQERGHILSLPANDERKRLLDEDRKTDDGN